MTRAAGKSPPVPQRLFHFARIGFAGDNRSATPGARNTEPRGPEPGVGRADEPYQLSVSYLVQVVRIEDFSPEEVLSAAEFRSHFEVALVFSTKYQPVHSLLDHWKAWEDLKRRFFGFHRDLPPLAAARKNGALEAL